MPSRLDNAAGIAKSRAQLETYRELERRMMLSVNGMSERIQAVVADSSAPQSAKDRFLPAFKDSLSASMPQVASLDHVRQQMFAEIDGILALAIRNVGQVRAQGNQILFSNSEALAEYQTRLNTLTKLAAQESDVMRSMQQNGQNGLQQYQNTINSLK